MSPHIAEEVFTGMDRGALTTIAMIPPRDPDEDEDEDDEEEDSTDEPAVVREPDED